MKLSNKFNILEKNNVNYATNNLTKKVKASNLFQEERNLPFSKSLQVSNWMGWSGWVSGQNE